MPTTWIGSTTKKGRSVEPDQVLAKLRETGALERVQRLMDEDAAGIDRASISFSEMRTILDARCKID